MGLVPSVTRIRGRWYAHQGQGCAAGWKGCTNRRPVTAVMVDGTGRHLHGGLTFCLSTAEFAEGLAEVEAERARVDATRR